MTADHSDEAHSRENGPGVDAQRYLAVLFRHSAFIVIFTLSAAVTALLLTYVLSEKYMAGATIFYHPTEMTLLRLKETEAFGAPVPVAPFKVIGQTLRDAVKSETILRPVVEELHLDRKEEPTYSSTFDYYYRSAKNFAKGTALGAWSFAKFGRIIEEDPTTATVRRLRGNINIEATTDSYIYILTVKYSSPKQAAMIVDVAGAALVDWLQNEYQSPARERLIDLESQLIEKEDQIMALREEKQALLDENNFISVAEEQSKGLKNLYDLELEDVRISSLIERKQRELTEYKEQMEKRFDTFMQSGDLGRLRSELLFGEAELEGLIAERVHIRSSIEDIKERLNKLPYLQKRLDTIDMKIDATTREYQHLKDFYTEVFPQVSTEFSEARVMHRAVVPSEPVQPIKAYHVLLAAVLGLFLSSGLVYVMDYFNINTMSPTTEEEDTVSRARNLDKRLTALPEAAAASFVLKEFARNMSAQGGSLFLRHKGELVLLHCVDPGHAPPTVPHPLGEDSILHRVMSAGEPLLIQNIDEEEGLTPSGWQGYTDKSLLAFPISDDMGRSVGVISLHNKVSPPFDKQDLELGMTLLAYHASHSVGAHPDSKNEPVFERVESQPRDRWHRIHPALRGIVIIFCGIVLGGIAFYVLRRIGY